MDIQCISDGNNSTTQQLGGTCGLVSVVILHAVFHLCFVSPLFVLNFVSSFIILSCTLS